MILNRDFDSLRTVLLKAVEVEKSISNSKLQLTYSRAFNSNDCFDSLTRGALYFGVAELKEFMEAHGYNCSYEELDLIFRRFDKSFSGRVSYKEFLNEISR